MSGDANETWVVPPPPADGYSLVVRLGEGVALSNEAIAALETLAAELADEDTTGFQRAACAVDWCDVDGKCQPKGSSPCMVFTSCRIVA